MRKRKWQLIADTLRREIKAQGVIYDVPSEHEASFRFDCARVTVRRAFQELQDEGLIEVVPGLGRRVIQ